MHLPCIYRVFGKEYDEHDPERTRRIGLVSNNSVKCPLCNQKTRLKNIVRLYLHEEGDLDEVVEGDVEVDFADEIIIVEDGSNRDAARENVRAALESNKARINELNTMLTSARRRYQVEVKEKMRLEQENSTLTAEMDRIEGESKRRLDAMRSERDSALRERKIYEKKAANLQVEVEKVKKELEEERAYSSRQAVALDDGLTGERLRRKLLDCGDTKEWFHDTLETRNRKIMTLLNGMEQLEKEVVRLKKSVETLEHKNRLLSLERPTCPDTDDIDGAVLSQIENVPVPKRKHGCIRGSGAWPCTSTSSKLPLSSGAASRDSHRDHLNDNNSGVDFRDCHGHNKGDNEKRDVPAEEVVLLDDDDDDIVGNFAASAAAAMVSGSNQWKRASVSFAMAGPSRDGIKTAPGPSFIKSSVKASTGLENPGKYIKRYPDGRGGWTQNGRKTSSSSGGARKIPKKNADISDFFPARSGKR